MEFTRAQLQAIKYNAADDDNNAWISQLEDGTHFAFTVSSLAAFALALLERAESAEAERDILAWANRNMAGEAEPVPDTGLAKARSDAEDMVNTLLPRMLKLVEEIQSEAHRLESEKPQAAEEDPVAALRDATSGMVEKVSASEFCASFNIAHYNDVAAACGEPDPHPEGECSKREPKGRWVGDREWEEDCSCDLDKQKADFFAGELLTSEPSRPHESLVWAMFLAVQIPSLSARSNVSDLVRVSDRILDEWRARWPEPEA